MQTAIVNPDTKVGMRRPTESKMKIIKKLATRRVAPISTAQRKGSMTTPAVFANDTA